MMCLTKLPERRLYLCFLKEVDGAEHFRLVLGRPEHQAVLGETIGLEGVSHLCVCVCVCVCVQK